MDGMFSCVGRHEVALLTDFGGAAAKTCSGYAVAALLFVGSAGRGAAREEAGDGYGTTGVGTHPIC
jgi:hypothetical protein